MDKKQVNKEIEQLIKKLNVVLKKMEESIGIDGFLNGKHLEEAERLNIQIIEKKKLLE